MVEKKADKKSKLTVKIIRVADLYQKASELFGRDDIFKNALALGYTENTVIDKIDRKGETYLIVEA